jgi:asparagine synthetase B (glutamine-hydrolysing)
VNALPSAFKIAGEWHKYILRKVAERHVPESIAWNRSKGQLSMPVARMLERGPLRDRFEEGLRTDGRLAEYYDVRGIRSLLDQHHPAEPGADHGNTLWRLLALDAWLRSW